MAQGRIPGLTGFRLSRAGVLAFAVAVPAAVPASAGAATIPVVLPGTLDVLVTAAVVL